MAKSKNGRLKKNRRQASPRAAAGPPAAAVAVASNPPTTTPTTTRNSTPNTTAERSGTCTINPSTIKGTDETGTYYPSHTHLLTSQSAHRDEYYAANATYWSSGGYNGTTDDEAMIGDAGGVEDGIEGLAFLDRYLALCDGEDLKSRSESESMVEVGSGRRKNQHHPMRSPHPRRRFDHAVDLGAGVGRLTKLVLLKRYGEVRLVEADEGWSKRSRAYLGRKRAARCCFTNRRVSKHMMSLILYWLTMRSTYVHRGYRSLISDSFETHKLTLFSFLVPLSNSLFNNLF